MVGLAAWSTTLHFGTSCLPASLKAGPRPTSSSGCCLGPGGSSGPRPPSMPDALRPHDAALEWDTGRRGALCHAQNPPFDAGHHALLRRQARIEECREATVEIGAAHPRGDRIAVVPVRLAPLAREALAPQRTTNLRHHRPPGRDGPAVERPEWTRPAASRRRYRSHGRPAWVAFATDPCPSKRKTDPAAPARSSVKRRQRGLPIRAAPSPTLPSRTKSTYVLSSSVGQWR
jgi:hypothetical protein